MRKVLRIIVIRGDEVVEEGGVFMGAFGGSHHRSVMARSATMDMILTKLDMDGVTAVRLEVGDHEEVARD